MRNEIVNFVIFSIILIKFGHEIASQYLDKNSKLLNYYYYIIIPIFSTIFIFNYENLDLYHVALYIILIITFLITSSYIYLNHELGKCVEKDKKSYKMLIKSIILIIIFIFIIEGGKTGIKKAFMIFIFISIVQVLYKNN